MDLNLLFHRHQAALMGAAASSSPVRRQEFAATIAGLCKTIGERQRVLGATFPLVCVAR